MTELPNATHVRRTSRVADGQLEGIRRRTAVPPSGKVDNTGTPQRRDAIMKNRITRWGLALSLMAFRTAAAADYLADFSQFPAYAYNTVAYLQGGAYVGCGPTTGAMMFAYFQARHSLTGLLTNPGTGADAGLNTAWALHGQSYMKTQNNGFGDVQYIQSGLEQYAADRGFSLKVTIHASTWYSDPASPDAAWLNAYGPYGDAWMNDGAFWIRNTNSTWTIDPDLFCDFMFMCLGQGVPVFLTIDTNADGGGDHWVALVGYDRTSKQYAFYNTYDTALHWADIYYMGDPAGKRANSISMVRTVELMLAEPDIAVDWTSWNFGSVEVGGDGPVQYLTVTNTGGSDLDVAEISLTGANASDFSILNGGAFTLIPGNGRQIGARFNPVSAGAEKHPAGPDQQRPGRESADDFVDGDCHGRERHADESSDGGPGPGRCERPCLDRYDPLRRDRNGRCAPIRRPREHLESNEHRAHEYNGPVSARRRDAFVRRHVGRRSFSLGQQRRLVDAHVLGNDQPARDLPGDRSARP